MNQQQQKFAKAKTKKKSINRPSPHVNVLFQKSISTLKYCRKKGRSAENILLISSHIHQFLKNGRTKNYELKLFSGNFYITKKFLKISSRKCDYTKYFARKAKNFQKGPMDILSLAGGGDFGHFRLVRTHYMQKTCKEVGGYNKTFWYLTFLVPKIFVHAKIRQHNIS